MIHTIVSHAPISLFIAYGPTLVIYAEIEENWGATGPQLLQKDVGCLHILKAIVFLFFENNYKHYFCIENEGKLFPASSQH